jgi:hypothetical protein
MKVEFADDIESSLSRHSATEYDRLYPMFTGVELV